GCAPDEGTRRLFWSFFECCARAHCVVSEFARLSLFDDTLAQPGRTRHRSINYVRELPAGREALWSGSAPKVRQIARKAERAGLTVRVAEDDLLLGHFERIYAGTMEIGRASCRERE